jgi:hypothetical protein
MPAKTGPYCGTPAVLWSDHCGVFVELLPSRALPPVERARPPLKPDPPILEPPDVDPRPCLKKPFMPGCGEGDVPHGRRPAGAIT